MVDSGLQAGVKIHPDTIIEPVHVISNNVAFLHV